VVSAGSRTSVLEQFFWNRGAKRLALLPGAARPDVFAAAHTHVTPSGALAGLNGTVVLDESDAALVPVAPGQFNGPFLSARSPQLAARVGGLAGGWLSPAGRIRVFRPGTLAFTVRSPEDMTLRIAGRRVRLTTGTPTQVYLCVSGSFGYAFSSQGYIGFRPVSARATFPTWTQTRSCGAGSALRIIAGTPAH
jgi:hypothetical protein